LKLPYLKASYTKSVGPIKFCIEIYLPRLLFFKTLNKIKWYNGGFLGEQIIETPYFSVKNTMSCKTIILPVCRNYVAYARFHNAF
jgi:hypothetical protein